MKKEKRYKYLRSHVNTNVRCEVCYVINDGRTIQEWFIDFDPTVFAHELGKDIEKFDKLSLLPKQPRPRRGSEKNSKESRRSKRIHALSSALAMEEIYLVLKIKYPKIKGFRIWGDEKKYSNTDISYSAMSNVLKAVGHVLGWKYHLPYTSTEFQDYKPGYWTSDRKESNYCITTNFDNLKKTETVTYKKNDTYSNVFPVHMKEYAGTWKTKIDHLNNIREEYKWGVQNAVTYKTEAPLTASKDGLGFPPHIDTAFWTFANSQCFQRFPDFLTRLKSTISDDGMLYLDSWSRSMADWNDIAVEIDGRVYYCMDLDYNAQGVHILAELCDVTLPYVPDIYEWIRSKTNQPITRQDIKKATNIVLQSENKTEAIRSINYQKNMMNKFENCNAKVLVSEIENINEIKEMLYCASLSRVIIDIQSKIEALTTLRLHENSIPAISKRDCWRVPEMQSEEARDIIEASWYEYWEEEKGGCSSYIPKIKRQEK